MKKLIVFGAGASFGSEDNMPPLSNSLFAKLVEAYPSSWGQIGEEVSRLFQDDFEKGMEKIAKDEFAIPNPVPMLKSIA